MQNVHSDGQIAIREGAFLGTKGDPRVGPHGMKRPSCVGQAPFCGLRGLIGITIALVIEQQVPIIVNIYGVLKSNIAYFLVSIESQPFDYLV